MKQCLPYLLGNTTEIILHLMTEALVRTAYGKPNICFFFFFSYGVRLLFFFLAQKWVFLFAYSFCFVFSKSVQLSVVVTGGLVQGKKVVLDYMGIFIENLQYISSSNIWRMRSKFECLKKIKSEY